MRAAGCAAGERKLEVPLGYTHALGRSVSSPRRIMRDLQTSSLSLRMETGEARSHKVRVIRLNPFAVSHLSPRV